MLAALAFALYLPLRFAPLFEGSAALSIRRDPRPDPAQGRPARRVLLVSIDGLAPRVLSEVDTPFLDRLAREGVRATRALTVAPPITMTSHASMLSGLAPERHGVFFNRHEPWRELRFPTLFTACAEQGLRCGLFAGKRKFVHFAEHEAGVERYQFGAGSAEVLRHAQAWAQERDPDFLFVHLAEVDLQGHGEGWGSDAQARAIQEIDSRLRDFVAAIREGTRPLAILVTADHGGSGTGHHEDLPENREIPWILWGAAGPADLDLREVSTLDTYGVVRGLLAER